MIVEKQSTSGWGDFIIDKISKDLKKEYPDLKGFSKRNLQYMRRWYLFYSPLPKKVQQVVAQIPWGHNVLILNKLKKPDDALYYVQMTINNNWSRDILGHQIKSKLHTRKGKSITNFHRTLPSQIQTLLFRL